MLHSRDARLQRREQALEQGRTYGIAASHQWIQDQWIQAQPLCRTRGRRGGRIARLWWAAVVVYVGVVPEQRGRGLAARLVRRGTEQLDQRLGEVRGDCDRDNVAMVKLSSEQATSRPHAGAATSAR
jgi:GNAT superfamily N-acetyltransferase